MRRLRIAVIGHGRLGQACVAALQDAPELALAGVVVRAGAPRPAGLPHGVPAVEHVRLLGEARAALLCVPSPQALDVARELLQQRMPVIECAQLEARALQAYYAELAIAARHHRVAAVLGAGWEPGVLSLMRRMFAVLIPRGRTEAGGHPGMALHHTALPAVSGVQGALTCEHRAADGRLQRYVYVQLAPQADASAVEQAIASDPVHAGTQTFVFAVPDLSALEPPAHGVVLARYGTGVTGAHESLLLEARIDEARFAARAMVDAARALPWLASGAHLYRLDGALAGTPLP